MSNNNNPWGDPGVTIGIEYGTVSVSDQTILANIDLSNGPEDAEPVPDLRLTNIWDQAPIFVPSGHGEIDASGDVYLQGGLAVGSNVSANLNINVGNNTTVTLGGTYVEGGSTANIVDIGHNSNLSNSLPDGDDEGIHVDDGKLTVGVTVSGNGDGEFIVNQAGTLAFTGQVKDQTILLGDDVTQIGGLLAIGDPLQFMSAVVAHTGGTIDLTHSHETSFSYLNDILKIYDNSHVIASFSYTLAPNEAFTVGNVGTDVRITAIAARITPLAEHPTMTSLMPHG